MIFMILALALQSAPPRLTPEALARSAQGAVGRDFGRGLTVTRIYAEEQTVVIVLDGPAGWRSGLSDEDASNLLIGGYCRQGDLGYFSNGNRMRVDTTEAGGARHSGPAVETCPPAQADSATH